MSDQPDNTSTDKPANPDTHDVGYEARIEVLNQLAVETLEHNAGHSDVYHTVRTVPHIAESSSGNVEFELIMDRGCFGLIFSPTHFKWMAHVVDLIRKERRERNLVPDGQGGAR